MARQVQIIKGTTEQNDAFTGAEGVLTYDTETKNLRIHDGTTEGGFEIPSSAMGDYVIYWDSADSTDHSHAKPGVSTPTDHGWYRYYKSGWVEQGGYKDGILVNTDYTIVYPIKMGGRNYTLTTGFGMLDADIYTQQHAVERYATRSTTGVVLKNARFAGSSGSGQGISWQVSGMSAQ